MVRFLATFVVTLLEHVAEAAKKDNSTKPGGRTHLKEHDRPIKWPSVPAPLPVESPAFRRINQRGVSDETLRCAPVSCCLKPEAVLGHASCCSNVPFFLLTPSKNKLGAQALQAAGATVGCAISAAWPSSREQALGAVLSELRSPRRNLPQRLLPRPREEKKSASQAPREGVIFCARIEAGSNLANFSQYGVRTKKKKNMHAIPRKMKGALVIRPFVRSHLSEFHAPFSHLICSRFYIHYINSLRSLVYHWE